MQVAVAVATVMRLVVMEAQVAVQTVPKAQTVVLAMAVIMEHLVQQGLAEPQDIMPVPMVLVAQVAQVDMEAVQVLLEALAGQVIRRVVLVAEPTMQVVVVVVLATTVVVVVLLPMVALPVVVVAQATLLEQIHLN